MNMVHPQAQIKTSAPQVVNDFKVLIFSGHLQTDYFHA